jgi:hypothetical protein
MLFTEKYSNKQLVVHLKRPSSAIVDVLRTGISLPIFVIIIIMLFFGTVIRALHYEFNFAREYLCEHSACEQHTHTQHRRHG